MKELLVVGDSLAGGLPYLNFATLLQRGLRDWRVTADAVGGDTLAGVDARLERLLGAGRPDALVIEAGTNDILLPFLEARGGLWRSLVERIEARGSIAATGLEDFRDLFSHTIGMAVEMAGRVVATTIACIGEEPESDPNRRGSQYSAVIREVAAERQVAVADVGRAFREALAEAGVRSGYLLDRLSGMLLDTAHMLTARGADRLSGRRGLVLTVDGVHLNRYGARLYARTVAAALGETI
ncbi:MAG: GDSL-type esterase/lipase family protein [Actinomycetota bacterium]|nr:GDSL-type esterase/lipase family protein [Actinomycetota bacterium]